MAPDSLTENLKARLSRGETIVTTEPVPGAAVPRIIVRAVIAAAPSAVWVHINDADRYSEFMPRTKRSRVVSREGDVVRTQVTIDMPFPLKNMTAITRAVHTVEPDTRYERAWTFEEGDYHLNEGSWVLVPFEGDPGRTFVTYQVLAHPKVMIPRKLQSVVQEHSMPKLIDALRKRTLGR